MSRNNRFDFDMMKTVIDLVEMTILKQSPFD